MSELPPIMNPEWSPVPMGIFSILPVFSHCRLLFFYSIAAFLGYPSCGSSGLECASRLSCGRMTVPTKNSKDRASWHMHGLRTPTPESSGTRKELLPNHSNHGYQPAHEWICSRTPILGGPWRAEHIAKETTVSLEQTPRLRVPTSSTIPQISLFHSRKPKYNFTVSP